MVGWWLSMALAAPVVPVQGYVTDAGGAPLDGTPVLGLTLYGQTGESPRDLLYTWSGPVAVAAGQFSARLGDDGLLDLDDLGAYDHLLLTVTVGGSTSDFVEVGWTPRAAWAHRASSALTAATADWASVAEALDSLASVDWTQLTSIPADLDDGDDDTLADLSCADGDAPIWSNTAQTWVCGAVTAPTPSVVAAALSGQTVTGGLRVDGGLRVGPAASCTAGVAGTLSYHSNKLWFCSSTGTWTEIGQVSGLVVDGTGVRQWSDSTTSATCKTYRDDSRWSGAAATSGLYRIDPDGAGASAPVVAWCDQTTDGGGWTLVFHAWNGDPVTKANQFTTIAAPNLTDPNGGGSHVSLIPVASYALLRNATRLKFSYIDTSGVFASTGRVTPNEVIAEGTFTTLFDAPGENNYVAVTSREVTGAQRVITSGPRVYWGTCSVYPTALRFDPYRDGAYYTPACHTNNYGNNDVNPANMDYASFSDGNGMGMGTVGTQGWGISAASHVYNIWAR